MESPATQKRPQHKVVQMQARHITMITTCCVTSAPNRTATTHSVSLSPRSLNTTPGRLASLTYPRSQTRGRTTATWLLEGRLMQTTTVRMVLITSAPIRKMLAERLRPRRIKAGMFEETSDPANTPSAPEPEISRTADSSADCTLPLREVDVVIRPTHERPNATKINTSGISWPGDRVLTLGTGVDTESTLRQTFRIRGRSGLGNTNRTTGQHPSTHRVRQDPQNP
ncbi:hypothetical protein EDB86DRAFT_2918683 [Lactarius hatsudake]|nr:hypothetical protein EDB86DRAFT_2918683 [Lactarius hatsudake]